MQRAPRLMNSITVSWAKRVVLAYTLLLGAAGVASADAVYDYTGLAFDSSSCLFGFFCAPFAPGPGPITLNFTVPTALPANLSGTVAFTLFDMMSTVATTPTSFSISDGLRTFSGVPSTFTNFDVATDAFGNIVQWNMGYFDGSFSLATINDIQNVRDGSATFAFQTETFHFIDQTGAWTSPQAAPVPEPASLLLLGTGLISAAALRRRRNR
jgi:hypothetical protein